MGPIEPLETRRLFASFTAASVADLISDINAANTAGGSNTITLAPATPFNLTAADNVWDLPTGLPVVRAGNDLTIVGNGDTIQRSTAAGTPAFRLLVVATGGSLTLSNVTLSNGLASHPTTGMDGPGGAVFSSGSLSLRGVTIQNCVARATYLGLPSWGGGIYSSGVLTIADSAIRNNQALGLAGVADPSTWIGGSAALGGGLYVAGGTATLTNTTVSSNLARGGDGAAGGFGKGLGAWPGSPGGDGSGGGIYVAGNATVTLRGTAVTQNVAQGGTAGKSIKGQPKSADGAGRGGGIYIVPGALVGLDAFTQANTRPNTASTSDNDILGSFAPII